MNKQNLKKVAGAIRKYNSFLITVHTSPEGDAIGSELAFYHLLRKLRKTAIVVNEDPTPVEYDSFPEKERIQVYKPNLKDIDFDCMVVLDCSDLIRTGEIYKLNKDNKPVINIDHHISNSNFGTLNLVDAGASSASELVYSLYKKMHVPFDKDSAFLLYVGIMTDTGSFRYSNTTSYTHRAVAELMCFGFDVRKTYSDIYENIPFADTQLLIKALAHVHLTANGRIAWVELPAKLLRHKKLSFDLSDHILSFIRSIKNTQVVVLFRENLGTKKEIRFNLRSSGMVDVNKVAQAFGGGGHKSAAGCTTLGKLSEVRRKVIAKICADLK
jgi:phosphoesterase RecJ-like protein